MSLDFISRGLVTGVRSIAEILETVLNTEPTNALPNQLESHFKEVETEHAFRMLSAETSQAHVLRCIDESCLKPGMVPTNLYQRRDSLVRDNKISFTEDHNLKFIVKCLKRCIDDPTFTGEMVNNLQVLSPSDYSNRSTGGVLRRTDAPWVKDILTLLLVIDDPHPQIQHHVQLNFRIGTPTGSFTGDDEDQTVVFRSYINDEITVVTFLPWENDSVVHDDLSIVHPGRLETALRLLDIPRR